MTTSRLKKLGHVQLRVADLERSKAFYRDLLGFRVAEQDPRHGDVFMTLGEDFHTLDLSQHPSPGTGNSPGRPLVQLEGHAFTPAARKAFEA